MQLSQCWGVVQIQAVRISALAAASLCVQGSDAGGAPTLSQPLAMGSTGYLLPCAPYPAIPSLLHQYLLPNGISQ